MIAIGLTLKFSQLVLFNYVESQKQLGLYIDCLIYWVFCMPFWSELSLLLPFLNASICAWLQESLLLYPGICSRLWSLDMTFYFYIAFWFTRYTCCGEITFWKDINREKFLCHWWWNWDSNWYFLKVKIAIYMLFRKKKKNYNIYDLNL